MITDCWMLEAFGTGDGSVYLVKSYLCLSLSS